MHLFNLRQYLRIFRKKPFQLFPDLHKKYGDAVLEAPERPNQLGHHNKHDQKQHTCYEEDRSDQAERAF